MLRFHLMTFCEKYIPKYPDIATAAFFIWREKIPKMVRMRQSAAPQTFNITCYLPLTRSSNGNVKSAELEKQPFDLTFFSQS